MRLVISIDMPGPTHISTRDGEPSVSVRNMIEVSRILRTIPQKLRGDGWTVNEPNPIRDANGRAVGYWTVSALEEDGDEADRP